VLASSYITSKARKGTPSSIEGRGLVAVAPISAGELVAIKGGHINLVAMRGLSQGEELTTDYALFDDYDGEMACNCGMRHAGG
jgi:hypothetical protein